MAPVSPAQRISSLFRRTSVLSIGDLERALPERSRRSLYRDLAALDYLASYTHAGGYYTLRALAPFDGRGLWFHQGVGFSVDGTLKATCRRLVEEADSGQTHGELALALQVRAHNALLDLVHEGCIGRESVGPTFLYVSAERERAAQQVQRRVEALRADAGPAPPLHSQLVVEILLELVRSSKSLSFTTTGITRQLLARGVGVTTEQVDEVLRQHGIVKKGRHSRSRSSRR